MPYTSRVCSQGETHEQLAWPTAAALVDGGHPPNHVQDRPPHIQEIARHPGNNPHHSWTHITRTLPRHHYLPTSTDQPYNDDVPTAHPAFAVDDPGDHGGGDDPAGVPRVPRVLAASARARPAGRASGRARLRHLLARNGVDFSRTIVAGFSQGAVMALLLGLTLDPPPAGIIMLSGYLPMPGDLGALFGRKGGERRGTIVHWLHGAKDGYFPLPAARRGFQQLQDLGLFAPENLAFSSMADLDHAWSAAELELLIRASLDRFLPAPPTPPPA
ncbi:hypothetical protein PtB15_4B740 [Puccinia triticina]|nr:hypothetical protein PtB15_4B740 [Puccinia triticina]